MGSSVLDGFSLLRMPRYDDVFLFFLKAKRPQASEHILVQVSSLGIAYIFKTGPLFEVGLLCKAIDLSVLAVLPFVIREQCQVFIGSHVF